MDRHHSFRVFVAVAAEGSLAAAARQLGLSNATIARCIDALESHFGSRLLERDTHGARLSPVGEALLRRVKPLLDSVNAAESSARNLHQAQLGHIVVAAASRLGREIVLPVITEFMAQYPQISVEARLADRRFNLHEEGIDVALQSGDLPDSSDVFVPLGWVRRAVVASPVYLDRAGTPAHPSQLREHQLVVSTTDAGSTEWRFRAGNRELAVALSPRLTTDSNDAAIVCAAGGLGITRVMSDQVASLIENGTLVGVLESFLPEPTPLQLLYREGRRAAGKVRAFIDFAVPRLRANRGITGMRGSP